jgi:hypothetical protein
MEELAALIGRAVHQLVVGQRLAGLRTDERGYDGIERGVVGDIGVGIGRVHAAGGARDARLAIRGAQDEPGMASAETACQLVEDRGEAGRVRGGVVDAADQRIPGLLRQVHVAPRRPG